MKNTFSVLFLCEKYSKLIIVVSNQAKQEFCS